MKRILTIFLIIAFSAALASSAFAVEKNRRKSRRGREIDEQIKNISASVQQLSQKYRDRSIWKFPYVHSGPPESAAHKAARYFLMIPTYAIRFVTWPFAIAGDEMAKHGIVDGAVNVLANEDRTFWVYPKIEFGFGSGLGGGIGLHHFDLFDDEYEASAYYQIHLDLNQEAKISIERPDVFYIAGSPVDFKAWTYYYRHHDTDFFGIGARSSKSNEAKYGVDFSRTGGYLNFNPANNLMMRWHSFFELNNSRHGKGGTPVESVFPLSTLTAFDKFLYYANFGVSLMHDTRNSDVNPEKGGLRQFTVSRYQGLGTTEYDYNEYVLDVSQYFNVFMPRNTLVLRNVWTFQQPTGGGGIPFYRLTRLDMYAPLRGFDYGRFADRSSVLLNIEYRFPVWSFLDAEFFFDTGRVFHKPTDFSFDYFKYDGGGGLRFRTNQFFLLRIEMGYGGEGVHVLAKTSQAF